MKAASTASSHRTMHRHPAVTVDIKAHHNSSSHLDHRHHQVVVVAMVAATAIHPLELAVDIMELQTLLAHHRLDMVVDIM